MFLGFDGGLHEGCTSLFESQGSEVVMEDCVIEISPDNSGSLAGDGLNIVVASGPDGGSVSRLALHAMYLMLMMMILLRRVLAPLGLGVQQLIALLRMTLKYFRTRGQVRGLLS